ncbi:MAG: hypothetical protein FJW36_16435 [Acidobacteria bacterium]|nr:hypothetical protein [Acidobacteriota bacterium]
MAGCFLYGELKIGDRATFGFCKAYDPPCGFTQFGTCLFPSRQNSLKEFAAILAATIRSA